MLEVTIVNLKKKPWYAVQEGELINSWKTWKQIQWPLENITLQSYSNSKM